MNPRLCLSPTGHCGFPEERHYSRCVRGERRGYSACHRVGAADTLPAQSEEGYDKYHSRNRDTSEVDISVATLPTMKASERGHTTSYATQKLLVARQWTCVDLDIDLQGALEPIKLESFRFLLDC